MMYCEACGAANETISGHCFACKQPFEETNIHDSEPTSAPAPIDVDEQQGDNSTATEQNNNTEENRQATSLQDGRYQIQEEVGIGGFGAVYRGIDTYNKRAVAIKEIRLQGLKPNEVIDATDTFNREVSILSELRHPNLPRIYNHFTAPEHWYLVMDFIEGQTLETYLDKTGGHLSLDEVFAIGIQLCTVLDYLHNRQPPIIFRDLKPTNIMITAYKQIYLIDFGAARYFKPGRSKDTIAFGSPGYASPEQYGKAQTTARSDIYSLGATLHEALTGKDPGESPFHFSFAQTRTGIPEELKALILRMVEMDASKRPTSAKAVRDELQRMSVQHLRRLYPLPGPQFSSTPRSPLGAFGQPPPASWATSAPSVQQAQMQLGLPPTPTPRKRGISRRAASAIILLGIASVAFMQNARWTLQNQNDGPAASQPEPMEANYQLKQQRVFIGHTESVTTLAWSSQADRIVSGSRDGTVRLWSSYFDDLDTIYTLGQAEVNAVAWSVVDAHLAVGSTDKENPVTLWNTTTTDNTQTHNTPIKGVMNTIAWSPVSNSLAIGGEDATVHILQTDGYTAKQTSSYSGHKGTVTSLAWSPTGDYLASASTDKTVRIWNVSQSSNNNILTTKYVFNESTASVNAIAWIASEGRDYIISGGDEQIIYIWNAATGEIQYTYKYSSKINAIARSLSGNMFAIGCDDGTLIVYRAFQQNPVVVYQDENTAIRSIAWSPDGMHIVVGRDDHKATVWFLAPEEEVRRKRRWGQ